MHSKQWHYSLHRDFQNCYSTRRSPTGFFKLQLQFQLQLQLQFYKGTRTPSIHIHLHVHIQRILHSEIQFYIQKTELFEYYYYTTDSRNSMHRRQGDLLEMHPCVLQDLPVTFQAVQPQVLTKTTPVTPVTPVAPETFRTFQSFMTIQPFQAILQCSSISRESTPFQHSPIRMHILQFDWFPQKTPPSTSWAITDITNITFFKEREMLRYRSN